MRGEFLEQKRQWKKLNAREFADLTASMQSVQKLPVGQVGAKFTLPPAAAGEQPFESTCGQCHTAAALSRSLANETWMSIGAGMWNHLPLMRDPSQAPLDDMRKILAYVWEIQYMGATGNAMQGQKIFSQKRCSECHQDKSPRAGKTFTPFSMVALGWSPGRQMHQAMTDKGIRWPVLLPEDTANLVEYLNTLQ